MSHCTYLITSVSTSGTARMENGGPSISVTGQDTPVGFDWAGKS